MKDLTLPAVGAGAILGAILATIDRPELPVSGQPAAWTALKHVFAPSNVLPAGYAVNFGWQLMILTLAGATIALLLAFVLPRLMKDITLTSMIGGASVGVVLAIVFRPGLAVGGQPPIGIALNDVFGSTPSLSSAYAMSFGWSLMILTFAGAGAGLLASYLLPKVRAAR